MSSPPESSWIFLNGRWVPREEARLSVFDHGFLCGDGVFETLRAYQGCVLWLERHLERLMRSCARIQLPSPIAITRWPSLLAELLARNGLSDAMIRITLSRGVGDWGLDPSLCSRPTVVALAKPVPPYSTVRKHGVQLEIATIRRTAPEAQPPEVKSISLLNNILAKQDALKVGAFDALMLNKDDLVAECSTSNVFFVEDGVLHTPARECGILDGITRGAVIDVARAHGMPVREGYYALDRLLAAEECFLTNTGIEIMPVRQIGDCRIGAVCPGPVTRCLQTWFAMAVHRYLSSQPEPGR